LTVRGSIIQGASQPQVDGLTVPCAAGSDTCTFSSTLSVPTTLVPGAATFQLKLLNAGVLVSTKNFPVTLVAPPPPKIAGVNLSSTSVLLDGPGTAYTVTIQNSGPALSNVTIQSFLTQDGTQTVPPTTGARRAAGGGQVQCGSGAGILPANSTCTTSFVLLAGNTNAGTGVLTVGLAHVELDLNVNGTAVGFGGFSVHIQPLVTVSGLSLSSTTPTPVVLEGPSVPYTITLQNIGSARSGISIRTSVVNRTANRDAGSTLVSCGGDLGVVPNGTCTFSFRITASNKSAGSGTLLAGDSASLVLNVVDGNGAVLTQSPVLAPLTLQSQAPPPPPGLGLSSSLDSTTPTDVILEGPSVPYSITIQNTGSARSGISIRTSVDQKTGSRDAGSALVSCGSGLGVVPTGGCTFSFQMTATNASAGSGTLLAGASANLVLNLVDANGAVQTQAPVLAPLNLLQGEGPPPPPSSNVAPAAGSKMSPTKP
jgi:hypothetical protein